MPRAKAGDAEILREAKARFERCVTWETAWRDRALFDTKFANGDPSNMWQWDTNVRTDRGSRPTLTYNQVRIHNLLVVNDARQNKAQIKVTPDRRPRHLRSGAGVQRHHPQHRVSQQGGRCLQHRHLPPGRERHRLCPRRDGLRR